jgi:polyisoprenoid-binding protein YceI
MNPRLLLLVPLCLVPLAFRAPATAPLASAPAEGAWKIDPVHSTVLFKIKHLGTSWTIGRFDTLAGEVSFDEAKPENSKVRCEIDTASVDTNNKKRDSDISGADYLSVKEFPKMTFASTKVAKAGEKFSISGDLTLHGVTKSITFTAEKVGSSDIKEMGGPRLGFYAETSIKRSDFGMKNMLEGASDEVALTLAIECTH